MNRVLVVPWSIAPTKSAMSRFLSDVESLGLLGSGQPPRLRWFLDRQEPTDQHLVRARAEEPAHDGPDDRDPEVQVSGLVLERIVEPGDVRRQAGSEVARRVDG